MARNPIPHTAIEPGPAAAAVETHWRFVPAMTKKRSVSRNPSTRRSAGAGFDASTRAAGYREAPADGASLRKRASSPWKWCTPFSRATEYRPLRYVRDRRPR